MDEQRYCELFSQLHTSVNEEEIVMKQGKTRKAHIGVLMLAAALVLALAGGVYAVYTRSVQELVIREAQPAANQTETETPVTSNAPEQSIRWDPIQEGFDFISLQGYADSPEKQAMEEWMQFLHTYDTDGSELAKVGNDPTPFDEKYGYNGYFVYTQEMADALDAIVEKYGLTLHENITFGDMQTLRERFGDFSTTDKWGGYWYSDGTFQYDGMEEIDGYGTLDYQFRRTMKGVFDEVGLNVNNADSYEQWSYTTACGETVLLALGPGKALIFADLDDCFVAVNVLAGTETDNGDILAPGKFSAKALEALADSFNFSLL